jgi:hypothetical protein
MHFCEENASNGNWRFGAIAQLGERVLCKHEVVGSIPSGSTSGRPEGPSCLSCGALTARRSRPDQKVSLNILSCFELSKCFAGYSTL